MDKKLIIKKTIAFAKKKLAGDTSGHDFFHIERVWKMAIFLAKKEKADLFVVELAALLHDIADWKFNDEKAGGELARRWLVKMKVAAPIVNQVRQIVDSVSFKGAGVANQIKDREGMVVQDADRLDALGAIGIARTFTYGGHHGAEIHNPGIKLKFYKTFSAYKNKRSTSINHFYEKMLLLKGRMNTGSAKKIAAHRHQFLVNYLTEFFQEWEAKK